MPALVSLLHRVSYAPVKPDSSESECHGTPMATGTMDFALFGRRALISALRAG
jgi:hypothetical protein